MPPTPAHDLNEIRRLAREDAANARLDERRAVEVVQDALGLTADKAVDYILAMIADLDPSGYSETLRNKPPPVDVYGCERDRRAWYVKVAIWGRRLIVVSCHPPTKPMRTRGGTVKR